MLLRGSKRLLNEPRLERRPRHVSKKAAAHTNPTRAPNHPICTDADERAFKVLSTEEVDAFLVAISERD